MSRFSGEYAKDWREIRDRVYAEVGYRCIRCLHPYHPGEHGKGEWTPCDDHCRHTTTFSPGPVDFFPTGKSAPHAQWRILTCHHFDGDKANNAWWNLMALCQRCHLQIQGKVNPETPYFLEHSEWIKPYVAGFYAKKYLQLDLTRDEVMAQLDSLLALEMRAA